MGIINSRKLKIQIGDIELPSKIIKSAKTTISFKNNARYNTGEIVLAKEDLDLIPLWDNFRDVKMFINDKLVYSGLIVFVNVEKDFVKIFLTDLSWIMKHQVLGSEYMIGDFSTPEKVYWLARIGGLQHEKIHIPSFVADRSLRPFIFAIPLLNATWSRPTEKPEAVVVDETFITTSDESDEPYSIVKMLMGGQEAFVKNNPIWARKNVKIFGCVEAKDFLEAQDIAFEKAQNYLDLIRFEQTHGLSRVSDRGSIKIINWDRKFSMTKLRLTDHIYLRDITSKRIKCWIRTRSPLRLDLSYDFNKAKRLFGQFLYPLLSILEISNLKYSKEGLHKKDKDYKDKEKLLMALRWYIDGKDRINQEDKILSLWFSFEQILATCKYPDVFGGVNKPIKDQLTKKINEIDFPDNATIDKNFLLDKFKRGDPFIRGKIDVFSSKFGIAISEEEKDISMLIKKRRDEIVHGNIKGRKMITAQEIRRFEFVIEKMLISRLLSIKRITPLAL